MKKPVTLILALSLIPTLTVYISFVRNPVTVYAQDGDELPDQNDVEPVIIALTRLEVNDLILDFNDQTLDVNDQTLELRWKIKNISDHDVWILDSVDFLDLGIGFEVYMLEDGQTLLIRRRLDVLALGVWYAPPTGFYVRLPAGEDLTDSISLSIPVRYSWLFTPPITSAEHARRIVVEIGYHTKDLPRAVSRGEERDPEPDMVDTVAMSYYDSAKEGEHALRITIDGVLIPYENAMLLPAKM